MGCPKWRVTRMKEPEQIPPPLPPHLSGAVQPVVEGEALATVDQKLEILIDERHAARVRILKRRKRIVTGLLLLMLAALVGLPASSPEMRADLRQAVLDVREGKMSVSHIVGIYRRHIAKLGKRQEMIREATLAMGVDPASVKDDDPHMLKEKAELIGNFDDSGPAPTLDSPLLAPMSDPDGGEVVMTLPALDGEPATSGEQLAEETAAFPAVALTRFADVQTPPDGETTPESGNATAGPTADDAGPVIAVPDTLPPAPEPDAEAAASPASPAPPPAAAVPPGDSIIDAARIADLWRKAIATSGAWTLRATTMPRAAATRLAEAGNSRNPDFNRCLAMIPVIDEKAATMQMQVSIRVHASCILSFNRIRFEAGSDRFLDEAARQQVRMLAEAMKLTPTGSFLIEGHTCDREAPGADKPLTERRARRVSEELVRQGVQPERLLALGFGAESPRVANRNDESRAVNRRITVCLLAR